MSNLDPDNKHAHDLGDVENLLRQVPLPAPSRALDARIDSLFRPHTRWILGPLAGFAAGVAASVAVFMVITGKSAPGESVGQTERAQTIGIATTQTGLARRGLSPDGSHAQQSLPVRVQRVRPRIVMLSTTPAGELCRADITLPEQMIVRPVTRY